MKISPYLFFDGDCEAAIKRYAEVLGGEVEAMMRFSDAPPDAGMPAGLENRVMHACLKVGEMRIMASDTHPGQRNKPQGFDVSLHIDDLGQAEKVFAGLSEGGSVNMPLSKTFWARGFGSCVDKFGVPWMVNCP